jgi:glycosyltransferase involved in cell wall biosynthesis
MEFINDTRNAVRLNDIEKVIPYLGNGVPQAISTDEIKRSKSFQYMCVSKKFIIVTATAERIEQNLLQLQTKSASEVECKVKVSLSGQFLNNAGYGKANRNLAYSLAAAGIDVSVKIDDEDSLDAIPQSDIDGILRFRKNEPTQISITSCVPSFAERPQSEYAILNTTVEAANVPDDFITTCEEFDEIWVVSDFCKSVLADHGITKPIIVVPNALNTSLYKTSVQPHDFKPQLKRFVFVCVATWGHRKGQDVLLRAYSEEFTASDDTTLLFVNGYTDGKDDKSAREIRAALSQKDHPHVARCGRSIPEYEMPRLYKACNAFVLVSRGEGFGLPYLEAGACGLPVVATRHSGHMMFLNDDNAYLLETDGLEEFRHGLTDIHYWDDHLFAAINSDKFNESLRRTLRQLYEQRHEVDPKVAAMLETVRQYSIPRVGKIAAERLRNVWKNHFTS